MRSLFRVLALASSLLLIPSHGVHAAPLSSATIDAFKQGQVISIADGPTPVLAWLSGNTIHITGDKFGFGTISKESFRDLLAAFNMGGSSPTSTVPINIEFADRVFLPEDSSELFADWKGGSITGLGKVNTGQAQSLKGMFKGTEAAVDFGGLYWDLSSLEDFSEFCVGSKLTAQTVDLIMPGAVRDGDWNKDCALTDRRTLEFQLGGGEDGQKITAQISPHRPHSTIKGQGTIDRDTFLAYRDALIEFDKQAVFTDPIALPSDSSELFKGVSKPIVGLDKLDVSGVKDMSRMFQGYSGDISETSAWNVRGVESFESMFAGSTADLGPLTTWLISPKANVTNMVGDNSLKDFGRTTVSPYIALPDSLNQLGDLRVDYRKRLQSDTQVQDLVKKLNGVNAPFDESALNLASDFLKAYPISRFITALGSDPRITCGSDPQTHAECLLTVLVFTYYPGQRYLDTTYRNKIGNPTVPDLEHAEPAPTESEESTQPGEVSKPAVSAPPAEAEPPVEAEPPAASSPAESSPARPSKDESTSPVQDEPEASTPADTNPPVDESAPAPESEQQSTEPSKSADAPRGEAKTHSISRVADSPVVGESNSETPKSSGWAWAALGTITLIVAVLSGLAPLASQIPELGALLP
ncbi:MAG: BspA family leucine-rich repeat surface protein [Corynebacterium sp.]|nr:BspA family leucine-rich repeat surface protein [Corynebacterium sp.]